VVSRRQLPQFRRSAGFLERFDSRQLHYESRSSAALFREGRDSHQHSQWHGRLGDVGFNGPRDGVMAGREASSACRQIRVVDYAFQPAAIDRHWAQHALGHRRPKTHSPTRPSRRRCDMFDVQENVPSVGRCGQHRSHVTSLAARCGLHTGTRRGRGSDRIDPQVRVADQQRER